MNILIINAGSSSIKYQLMAMPSEQVICTGMVERIGETDTILRYQTDTVTINKVAAIPDHKEGFKTIAELLLDPRQGVIKNTDDIALMGHRVVHGGNSFSKTTAVTQAVKDKIHELSVLAPLHNPHNLEGIIIAEEIFENAKQFAVFDTAFHHTIPVIAKKYAIPNELFKKHRIQVYGFHGTSHKYVAEQTIAHLQLKQSKLITIHLGNGCSMTAIKNGKSIDHSMGFAPANGLIMGSRSGDIDHSLIFHMVHKLDYSLAEVNKILTKHSGMLALTGFTDLRDIQKDAENGNTACQLALEMNAYRIKKYIGAYTAVLNGLDAIVFTAGIGENSSVIRKLVCTDMNYLGITLDDKKNTTESKKLREINTADSKVKVLVVPTDEELEIARQVYSISSDQ